MNDKDTIYRQKTIDDILQLMPPKLRDYATAEEQINYVAWRCALGCAISVVGTQPIAEPERKKGKWVKKNDAVCYWYECSVCGEKTPLSIHRQEWHSSYCPNCGAEMTGGDSSCTT